METVIFMIVFFVTNLFHSRGPKCTTSSWWPLETCSGSKPEQGQEYSFSSLHSIVDHRICIISILFSALSSYRWYESFHQIEPSP